LSQTQLIQNNISFNIEDAGIVKKTSSKNGVSELHYSFESITNNKVCALEDNKALLVIATIMAVISIISFAYDGMDFSALICFALSGLLYYLYYKTRVKKLYVSTSDGQPLFFVADNPNLEEVAAFVDAVYAARNVYLLSKYSNLTKHVDYASQLNNLNWLLNNRVLSKGQYDQKIEELNSLFNSPLGNKPIGFYKSN
jgi:hypothetical protein